jgi:transposase-like protein
MVCEEMPTRGKGQNFDKKTRTLMKMAAAYLYGRGFSGRAIGRILSIDEYTVRSYLKDFRPFMEHFTLDTTLSLMEEPDNAK